MKTRKSKIARLPLDVREELNRRLENGEPGTDLVTWLNGHPKVKEVMAARFEGREITEQNLSEWRKGGHQDWLAREEEAGEAEDFAEAAQKLAESTEGRLTDHLSTVLAARYATLLTNWKGEVTPEFRRKLEVLRALRKDVVALRRSEHEDIRVTMAQQRFEWDQERFDWEAEKAEDESLEREFAKKEEHRRKLRHIQWLTEMDEKYSKPPPPEKGETKGASRTGNQAEDGKGVTAKDAKAGGGKNEERESSKTLEAEHPTSNNPTSNIQWCEQENEEEKEGGPSKSNQIQSNPTEMEVDEAGKEEPQTLNVEGKQGKTGFKPRMNTDKHGLEPNIEHPRGEEEGEMQNAEKSESGPEPAAEAKAENEDAKQHLVEEAKPKEMAEEGNAPQMSDVEAYVLAEKKKVRVDAIVTSRRWSRHWRGLEG